MSVPLSIMGAGSVIGGFLAMLVPETLGQPLPENVQVFAKTKNKVKKLLRYDNLGCEEPLQDGKAMVQVGNQGRAQRVARDS